MKKKLVKKLDDQIEAQYKILSEKLNSRETVTEEELKYFESLVKMRLDVSQRRENLGDIIAKNSIKTLEAVGVICVGILGIAVPWKCYMQMFSDGLKFEKEGIVTSYIFKSLFSKIRL